jgi:HepT-like protein
VKNDLAKLAKRIRTELIDLEQVVTRCERALARSKTTSDDLYLDSIALNLEGFYSGLERLLQLIAATIDGKVPHGSEWHKELLDQLCEEIPGLRPAVLSESAKTMLERYRRLRHVVRVIYTFRLEPQKLEEHTRALRPTYVAVKNELDAFAALLEQRSKEN